MLKMCPRLSHSLKLQMNRQNAFDPGVNARIRTTSYENTAFLLLKTFIQLDNGDVTPDPAALTQLKFALYPLHRASPQSRPEQESPLRGKYDGYCFLT